MSAITPGSKVDEAKRLLSEKRYRDAQVLLTELDVRGQSTAESQYLLGVIYHRNNVLPDAVRCFKRSLLLDPAFTDAALSLSIIYNDTGHYSEGKTLFEQAEKSLQEKQFSSPVHSVVLGKEISKKHQDLGELYRKLLRFDEAAHEFLKATRIDPANHEARILLAKMLAQKGQSDKAFEELNRLIKDFPDYTPARIHLAMLYYASGNVVDAQMELAQAHQQDPSNPQVKMYMALTHSATESTL